ncbi:MAG: extracellular solute-binding protein [Acidimicrobiales bacterium]
MEFRVLGKLEVVHDGQVVDVGPHRQRSLLALLLTKPNTVFSTDRIIDALWGEGGGADKQNSLWVYISGLRKALEPDREKRSEGSVLLTRAPGYLVSVDEHVVDSVRFERLVAEGRALAHTDPAAASLVLGEALALWRGSAFEDFTYEEFAQTEIARLEELRLEAVEARIEADLERGMARELVSELETLVRQHPLREDLTAKLMVALFRSGRQAEALRTYQRLHGELANELGIAPSKQIQQLESRMVSGDEGLANTHTSVRDPGARPGLAVRGYELREKIGSGAFGVAYRAYQPAVGREVAIKVIQPELANDPNFIRRFEAEAQLVAKLEHPNIVPLYDYWREPGAAYLVMRLMRGGSLADVIDQSALSSERAVGIVEQVGGALHAAHRQRVVHRDIKPENVLIDDDGNAYLADFGVAVGVDEESASGSPVRSTVHPPFASPEQLAHGEVSYTSDIYSLGVVMAQALTGLKGDIGQIRGALPASVAPVIDRATATDATRRYDDARTFVTDLHIALGSKSSSGDARTWAPLDNPYKGLRSFRGADEGDFYGRERLVDRLIGRLGRSGAQGRFVAVVGPSGSGKSSVVRAGLLPALRDEAIPGSDDWFSVEMTPAPHPFEALEDALRSVAVTPAANLLEQLVSTEHGLTRGIGQVLPDDGSQLILLVDQFEELFTQVAPAIASRFIDMLVSAVGDPHSRLRLVITIRADFYDRPLRHRGIGELLHDGTQIVTPMTPQELERAITAPAEQLGVTIEPGLVAELVHDVADRTGALPLLQYTLTELFETRAGNRITADAYRELGGVSGAVAERAEGLLIELGGNATDVARQVFLRLVTIGEDSEDTRRRVLQRELEQLAVDRAELDAVLDTFGRHRLIGFDRDPVTRSPTVEISHEALLTEWGRLSGWIESARHDVRNQRRLAEAMHEWNNADHNPDYLLRGGRLDQLSLWAGTSSLSLSVPEAAFLDASLAERDRATGEEQAKELRVAEAERHARRRLLMLTGSGVVIVLVAGLALFGILQWRSASEARDEIAVAGAESLSLSGSAQFQSGSAANLNEDPELALLLSVEAVRSTAPLGFATEEAVDSLHWALQRLGVTYPVGADAPFVVRSGPNGLTGVFVMSPAELVALAETATDRRLTDAECELVLERSCPQSGPVPADLPLRFGDENYRTVIPDVVAGATAAPPLAGTKVRFAATNTMGGNEGLELEFEKFEARTGIEVEIVPENFLEVTVALSTAGVQAIPDVATFFTPVQAADWPTAVDLFTYLDTEQLRDGFGDYMIDLGSIENGSGEAELRSLPMVLVPDGLVFYAPDQFAEAGYEVPRTWQELLDLSNQIVADGRAPWCFHYESDFASGWPGVHFLEDLVMRVGGLDALDALAAGDLAFDDPIVLEAGRLADQLVFSPGFVADGPQSISQSGWAWPVARVLETHPVSGDPGPECWLVVQSAWMLGVLGPETGPAPAGVLGETIDFFTLPTVDGTASPGVTAGAEMVAALGDRPEIRSLIQWMSSRRWGEEWAKLFVGDNIADPFFSPHRQFDRHAYLGDRSQAEFDRRLALHDLNHDNLEAGTWRLHPNRLMPRQFANWTDTPSPGPVLQGILDWVDGKKSIEEALRDIESVRGDYRPWPGEG